MKVARGGASAPDREHPNVPWNARHPIRSIWR